jgi:hypothetical protein
MAPLAGFVWQAQLRLIPTPALMVVAQARHHLLARTGMSSGQISAILAVGDDSVCEKLRRSFSYSVGGYRAVLSHVPMEWQLQQPVTLLRARL